MFSSFLFSSRFVYAGHRFDNFYNNVRGGEFPEYKRFWRGGNYASNPGDLRPPTKDQLDEMVHGEGWKTMDEKERALKLTYLLTQLQERTQNAVHGVTADI